MSIETSIEDIEGYFKDCGMNIYFTYTQLEKWIDHYCWINGRSKNNIWTYGISDDDMDLLKVTVYEPYELKDVLKDRMYIRNISVTVLYGDPGIGKTSWCLNVIKRNGWSYYTINGYDKYLLFDGYIDQEVLLIDDYDGALQYSKFLGLIDKYPLTLDVKGGYIWARWKYVFITSNIPPCEWYKNYLVHNSTKMIDKRIHKLGLLDSTGIYWFKDKLSNRIETVVTESHKL